jgi:23S rRNA (uracil1939-C5)-methyltransferase
MMRVKKNQVVEVEVENIAFGGKGLAKLNGYALFIDQAVPGDLAAVRIIKKKKSYAEARVEQLIKPSPLRIDAPCPYSGYCGGCKWQFLAYDQQTAYKKNHVQESLQHIGRLYDVPVLDTLPSPNVFGYRNKMEFTCARRRWLLPEEMAARDPLAAGMGLGLHVPGTFYKVLDTRACLLQPDLGNHILNDVRQYIKGSHLPVYDLRSHTGFWRFVTLRHSAAHDNWMVNLVTAQEDHKTVQPLADTLMKTHPQVVSVVNNITDRKAGVAVGQKEVHLGGSPHLIDRIGNYDFKISANSFFQTNTAGAAQLYATVKDYAGLEGHETVLDLYCGTGTIGIYLSDAAREIIGIEQVGSSVGDAENNCQTNHVNNCRFIQGDMRDCLQHLDIAADVMIVDPPRAGMHKDVVRRILKMLPEKIVYVSCNPAALARDVALMSAHYHIAEVKPVDLFPHTYHIESVSLLIKRG